jgi:hypothetical protein
VPKLARRIAGPPVISSTRLSLHNQVFSPSIGRRAGTLVFSPGLPSAERGGTELKSLPGICCCGATRSSSGQTLMISRLGLPVSATAVSLRVDTLEDFIQPGPSVPTDWVYVDEDSATFVVRAVRSHRFKRERPDFTATYNFYTSLMSPVRSGSARQQSRRLTSFPADGETYYAFTDIYVEWPTGGRILDDGFKTTRSKLSAHHATRLGFLRQHRL